MNESIRKIVQCKLYIEDHVSKAALYEGLAEECIEVAKEAQKAARILRNENPTPAKLDETIDRLENELGDIFNYMITLHLQFDIDDSELKMERWVRRIERNQK